MARILPVCCWCWGLHDNSPVCFLITTNNTGITSYSDDHHSYHYVQSRHARVHMQNKTRYMANFNLMSFTRRIWRYVKRADGSIIADIIHCGPLKTCHLIFVHNFDKYWPIFAILLLSDSSVNLPRGSCHISHHTCNASPPAFDAPVRGIPVGISPSRFVWKN